MSGSLTGVKRRSRGCAPYDGEQYRLVVSHVPKSGHGAPTVHGRTNSVRPGHSPTDHLPDLSSGFVIRKAPSPSQTFLHERHFFRKDRTCFFPEELLALPLLLFSVPQSASRASACCLQPRSLLHRSALYNQ